MKSYRVHARVVCDCPLCKEEIENNEGVFEGGVPFSDEFVAKDCESAIALARSKFVMIHDDVEDEFKNEGHEHRLEIVSCEELK